MTSKILYTQPQRAAMNIKENVCIDIDNNNHCNDNVYGLITELSRHILQTYRSFHRNIQFTYDHDIKIIKHLRIKAFEILLKKGHQLISSQGIIVIKSFIIHLNLCLYNLFNLQSTIFIYHY